LANDFYDGRYPLNAYSDRLNTYIDLTDPADQENYYRWNCYSYVMRRTFGISCGFGCTLYEYCFQYNKLRNIQLQSDAAINGNTIHDKLVEYSYIYWYGNHYIDIGQLSISREAYQFWQRYEEQVTRTGGLLDPLPASIKGNVYNVNDTTDLALGYFEASSIV